MLVTNHSCNPYLQQKNQNLSFTAVTTFRSLGRKAIRQAAADDCRLLTSHIKTVQAVVGKHFHRTDGQGREVLNRLFPGKRPVTLSVDTSSAKGKPLAMVVEENKSMPMRIPFDPRQSAKNIFENLVSALENTIKQK